MISNEMMVVVLLNYGFGDLLRGHFGYGKKLFHQAEISSDGRLTVAFLLHPVRHVVNGDFYIFRI